MSQKTLAAFWGKSATAAAATSAASAASAAASATLAPAALVHAVASPAASPAAPMPVASAPAAAALAAASSPAIVSAVAPAPVPSYFSASSGAGVGLKRRQPLPEPASAAAPPPPAAKQARTAAAAKGKGGAASAASALGASGGARISKSSFSAVKITGIEGAEYFDETIDWLAMRDGRHLLLGREIYDVPLAGGAPTRIGKLPSEDGSCDIWCGVPGLDLICCTQKGDALAFYSPSDLGTPVARVTLPQSHADRWIGRTRRLHALPQPLSSEGGVTRTAVLALTRRHARVVIVEERAHASSSSSGAGSSSSGSSSGSSDYSASLALSIDLNDATTPLGRELAFPAPAKKPSSSFSFSSSLDDPELVQCAALWLEPGTRRSHALLGSKGRLLVVPLPLDGASAASSSSSSSSSSSAAAVGGAGAPALAPVSALAPVKIMELHEPMRKSDKLAAIHDFDIYWHGGVGGAGACSVASVGSDGNLALTPLHDGAAFVSSSWPTWTIHATSNGSGGSKGYPYAPATFVRVCSPAGVAFTATSFHEPFAYYYDLDSAKTSQAGKTLLKTGKLGSGAKLLVQTVGMSPSGVIAYSNSNNMDDPVLKIIRPVGK